MKTRRHAKILELIAEKDIDTQEELLRCLRECGFDVTRPPFPAISKNCASLSRFRAEENINIQPEKKIRKIFPPNSFPCSAIPSV